MEKKMFDFLLCFFILCVSFCVAMGEENYEWSTVVSCIVVGVLLGIVDGSLFMMFCFIFIQTKLISERDVTVCGGGPSRMSRDFKEISDESNNPINSGGFGSYGTGFESEGSLLQRDYNNSKQGNLSEEMEKINGEMSSAVLLGGITGASAMIAGSSASSKPISGAEIISSFVGGSTVAAIGEGHLLHKNYSDKMSAKGDSPSLEERVGIMEKDLAEIKVRMKLGDEGHEKNDKNYEVYDI